jgi:hypothetical protein
MKVINSRGGRFTLAAVGIALFSILHPTQSAVVRDYAEGEYSENFDSPPNGWFAYRSTSGIVLGKADLNWQEAALTWISSDWLTTGVLGTNRALLIPPQFGTSVCQG